jgi:hypothetical protein
LPAIHQGFTPLLLSTGATFRQMSLALQAGQLNQRRLQIVTADRELKFFFHSLPDKK